MHQPPQCIQREILIEESGWRSKGRWTSAFACNEILMFVTLQLSITELELMSTQSPPLPSWTPETALRAGLGWAGWGGVGWSGNPISIEAAEDSFLRKYGKNMTQKQCGGNGE